MSVKCYKNTELDYDRSVIIETQMQLVVQTVMAIPVLVSCINHFILFLYGNAGLVRNPVKEVGNGGKANWVSLGAASR